MPPLRAQSCGLSRLQRKINLKKMLVGLLVFCVSSYLYLHTYQINDLSTMKRKLTPRNFCSPRNQSVEDFDDLKVWGPKNRNTAHILIVSSNSGSSGGGYGSNQFGGSGSFVPNLLASLRIKYRLTSPGKHVAELAKGSRSGKYFVVVFDDMRDYYMLDAVGRGVVDDYCTKFQAGLVGFISDDGSDAGFVKAGGPTRQPVIDPLENFTAKFSISYNERVKKVEVLHHPKIFKILKSPVELDISANKSMVGFHVKDEESFEPLVVAKSSQPDNEDVPLVIHQPRGIRKVVIGGPGSLPSWLVKLVFIDAVQWLANRQLVIPLTRYIMVDIDDIFVGKNRLRADDVDALIASQNRIADSVTGFRFNLGFSGGYFLSGSEEEDRGDLALVKERHKFWWFPHMWKHTQPHKIDNVTKISFNMQLNKAFAAQQDIPVKNKYSVSPHHSGVYPVHQILYDAWTANWGIEVTSTEEYPNLRPARRRRGFLHSGIQVLPRQTCGLYTHNLYYDEYPGSPAKLEASVQGGELFQTILTNPISIFMTHMPNYGYDRLAGYTFESVINFISCYTNLHLKTVRPTQLADKYFQLFPEERNPVWSNPCKDKRHLDILSPNKSCSWMPNMLVIGPQKTGSTALHAFLNLHTSVTTSLSSKDTFEEVQFFNSRNYGKGLDWYESCFPPTKEGKDYSVLLFEKSATYFDEAPVPLRAHKLLPDAKIVTILIRPEARAYSWYQHMRAHSNEVALKYTFKQVVMAGSDAPQALLSLRSRCLEPGKYAQHLERWLAFYRSDQLYVIDGEELKESPVNVMNELQTYLGIPFHDYNKKLVWDKKKGFYCQLIGGRKKCLGAGKGRHYPEMEAEVKAWLLNYYKPHNLQLSRLMTRNGYSRPAWLTEILAAEERGVDERGRQSSTLTGR